MCAFWRLSAQKQYFSSHNDIVIGVNPFPEFHPYEYEESVLDF